MTKYCYFGRDEADDREKESHVEVIHGQLGASSLRPTTVTKPRNLHMSLCHFQCSFAFLSDYYNLRLLSQWWQSVEADVGSDIYQNAT